MQWEKTKEVLSQEMFLEWIIILLIQIISNQQFQVAQKLLRKKLKIYLQILIVIIKISI